jgi:hypothetical protein
MGISGQGWWELRRHKNVIITAGLRSRVHTASTLRRIGNRCRRLLELLVLRSHGRRVNEVSELALAVQQPFPGLAPTLFSIAVAAYRSTLAPR